MSRRTLESSGFSAIWVALVLLFLVGSAALAVDSSGFFQQARVQQNATDFACLAGVRQAPSNAATAVDKAAVYLRANMNALSSMPSAPDSGTSGPGVNTYTMTDFTVEIETPWDDGNTATRNDALMRVSILQARAAGFGQVLGVDTVDIVQEAYCQVGNPLNLGELPLALDASAVGECETTGDECTLKFSGPDCVTDNGPGNCGSIDIPRHDDPAGSSAPNAPQEYVLNVIHGINWDIEVGNPAVCSSGGSTNEPCGKFKTVTGNKPDQLTNAFITGQSGFPGRLDRDAPHAALSWPDVSSFTVSWDGHQLADAALCQGGCGGDTTAPAAVTRIFDCNEPRWTSIPVVDEFDPGSNPDGIDYLGSRFAWIQEPDTSTRDPNVFLDPVHPGEDEFGPGAQAKLRIVAVRIISFPLGEDTPIDNAEDCGFFEFEDGLPSISRLINP